MNVLDLPVLEHEVEIMALPPRVDDLVLTPENTHSIFQ